MIFTENRKLYYKKISPFYAGLFSVFFYCFLEAVSGLNPYTHVIHVE